MDAPKFLELRELFAQHRWALALDKVPHSALNGKPQRISVSEPQAWTTYELAATWAKRHKGHVGLLLGGEVTEGWILVGVDIDWKSAPDAKERELPEALRELTPWLRETYAEWSVSGKGLHILGLLPREKAFGAQKRSVGGIGIEIYAYAEASGRHFVTTLSKLDSARELLVDISELVDSLLPPEPKRTTTPYSIQELIGALRQAPQGTRHNTLIHLIGRAARAGLFSAFRDAIRDAAIACGLPAMEVERALRDGERWEAKALAEIAKRRKPYSGGTPAPDGWGYNARDWAERFCAYLSGDALYAIGRGYYVWDGTRWLRDGDDCAILERMYYAMVDDLIATYNSAQYAEFREALAKRCSKRYAQATVGDIRPLLRHLSPQTHFDAEPHLLNTPTGLVDLRTGELYPHDSDRLISKITNAPYVPDAMAPVWERFLVDVFAGDRELINWIQKLVGYAATGEVRGHVFAILWGTGANGKSTFVNTLRHVLGDYAGSVPVEIATGDKSAASERLYVSLYGLRMAIIAETADGATLRAERIKALTGGDDIYARFLYREGFTFTPTHKLFVLTNHKPRVRSTDYGTWRRIRLIPFTQQFRGAQADPTLPDKLRSEADGILRWIVAGAVRYYAEGLGDAPPAVVAATEEYRRENDPLEEWIYAHCEIDPKGKETAKALYESYKAFAEANGDEPLSQNAWGRRLTEKGFSAFTLPGGVRVRKGIRLKAQ